MEEFDLTVIGGGPGGYPAAIRAAQLGASVALVEKEDLGGTCLNWGCIPTKTLIASSELYWRARHGAAMGVHAENVSADYKAMVKRKQSVVQTLQSGVSQLLKANGVKVFAGAASFRDRHCLAVRKGKRTRLLKTAATVIATGSESAVPGFLPRHRRVKESRGFLDLKALPRSLIVLGGGVIGCEFACLAAQLGVRVTVVELLEDILLVLDNDVRQVLKSVMQKELGIAVLTGHAMESIEADGEGVRGLVDGDSLQADMLLASVGRSPVTRGLALERIGLQTGAGGGLPVDATCRTRTAAVYAVGDVTEGSTQLAHAATAQGITAAENAVRGTRRPAETLVPACIFTAPEIGCVGLTETLAREQGMAVQTGKFPFAALGKAMAAGDTTGFVKWIACADTGRLAGAQAVGPHATELVSEATGAIQAEMTAEDLGATIHAHPTLSEAWMEAAHALHGTCIHAAPKRRK